MPEAEAAPLGLIGLGLLGTAIASRVTKLSRPMVIYDRIPERMDIVLNELSTVPNVRRASSSTEVFEQCPDVVLCLYESADVQELLTSVPLQRGQLIIDTTTGDPDSVEAIARTLQGQGVDYIEATVGGSSEQLRRGTALLFLGGIVEVIESQRTQAVLKSLSEQLHTLGPSGAGAKFKLIHNLILGLNRAALAEGLHLAAGLGLNLSQVLAVLQQSPARSEVMQTKGERMLQRTFAPQARLAQHLKDVRLLQKVAARQQRAVPLTERHCELLELAVAVGLGDLDNSAIMAALEHWQPA